MDKTVVRCKDCKNYKQFADMQYGECALLKRTMKDSDYCSYAQLKFKSFNVDDHTVSGLIDE